MFMNGHYQYLFAFHIRNPHLLLIGYTFYNIRPCNMDSSSLGLRTSLLSSRESHGVCQAMTVGRFAVVRLSQVIRSVFLFRFYQAAKEGSTKRASVGATVHNCF
jgi:hypothetical protein